MEIINIRIIKADNGHYLYNEAQGIISPTITLGKEADPNDWQQITAEQAAAIQAEQEAKAQAEREAYEAEQAAAEQENAPSEE